MPRSHNLLYFANFRQTPGKWLVIDKGQPDKAPLPLYLVASSSWKRQGGLNRRAHPAYPGVPYPQPACDPGWVGGGHH